MEYEVEIAGIAEKLPVVRIGERLSIAYFNLHGKAGLTRRCADELAKLAKADGAEVLLTAESKGLQLTHCVAESMGHDFYAVARKSKKKYLDGGITVEGESITTANTQTYTVSGEDAALMRGKKVGIVDDVISTGGSLKALEKLVNLAGGEVAGRYFVLAEGDAAARPDIKYLAAIPLFFD